MMQRSTQTYCDCFVLTVGYRRKKRCDYHNCDGGQTTFANRRTDYANVMQQAHWQ